MTDKITLSQDEVEHTNQRYREAHGEAIGRMAAMSVMGSTIEELERENSDLRAELIDNYAASCMDAGVILELRARVGEIEARYDNVTISLKEKCKELNGEKNHRNIWHRTACDEAKENAKLRAELAAIKPDWSDAPPEAKWLAQDEDTYWLFWEIKPVPGKQCRVNEWENGGDYFETTIKGWQNTLERRPEES